MDFIRNRSQYIFARLPDPPEEPTFAVTFSESAVTTRPMALIEGRGWIDFKEVRLNGGEEPAESAWWSEGTGRDERFFWRFEAPVQYGRNVLEFQPNDFTGNAFPTQTVTVHSTYNGELGVRQRTFWVFY